MNSRDWIKLELDVQGKEVILASTFQANLKHLIEFHKLLLLNDEVYHSYCISYANKRGSVFYVKGVDIKPDLKSYDFLYCVNGDLNFINLTSFIKLKREVVRIGSRDVEVPAVTMILNRGGGYSIQSLIFDFYFKTLNHSFILSDELYSNPEGKNSLYDFITQSIGRYYVYLVSELTLDSRIHSIEELDFVWSEVFGDSVNYSTVRFLVSSQKL